MQSLNLEDSTVLDALWDNSQTGLAIVAADGKWVRTNRTLCALLEYSEAELRATTWMALMHPGDLDADLEMAKDVAGGAVAGYDMLKRYITKGGRVIWLSLRVVPLHKDGAFIAHLSQMSAVVPVAGPSEERRRNFRLRWLRDYWAQIIVALSAAGVVAAETIKIRLPVLHHFPGRRDFVYHWRAR